MSDILHRLPAPRVKAASGGHILGKMKRGIAPLPEEHAC